MKVTTISNGSLQIVLKPETPREILDIKELHDKQIVASYHEVTQILEVSSPNCLVLTTKKSEPDVEQKLPDYVAVVNIDTNSIIGMIPTNTTEKDVLSFLQSFTTECKITLSVGQSCITLNDIFSVDIVHENAKNKTVRYALKTVQFYKL